MKVKAQAKVKARLNANVNATAKVNLNPNVKAKAKAKANLSPNVKAKAEGKAKGGDMGGIRVVPIPRGLTTYVGKSLLPKSKCTHGGKKIVKTV